MTKHEDFSHSGDLYVPEQVDEQLESILRTGQASPRDQRLLEGLLFELSMQQDQASTTDAAGAGVLTRVYFRLQHMEEMQRLKEQPTQPTPPSAYPERTLQKRGSAHMKDGLMHTVSENNDVPPQGQLRSWDKADIPPKRRGRELFALLAAVALIGIVVGSFVIFAQRNHAPAGNLLNNQHKPAKATPTPAVVLPNSLYVTGKNVVMKLDKHTGKVLWTFHVPGQSSRFPTPPRLGVNSDRAVFFFHASQVYAIDAMDGHQLWSYTVQNNGILGTPTLSGETLYMMVNTGVPAPVQNQNGSQTQMGATGGYLLALNAQTGHVLWRTPLQGASDGNLSVANGLVYVDIDQFNGGSIHGIQAIQVKNGAPVWWASTAAGQIQSRPLVTQSLVYTFVTDSSNNQNISSVHAFDAQTGASRWESAPIPDIAISGVTPIMFNNKIYFCANFGGEATMIGKIFVLDPLTGQQIEVHNLPLELYQLSSASGHIYVSYATHNGTSIATYGDSGLLELDALTYQQLKIYQLQNFPDYLLDNGVLYLELQNQVEALDSNTGQSLWTQDISTALAAG